MATLSFDELRTKLGMTRAQLAELVRQGLPYKSDGKRKRFDPANVRDWLIKKGLAVVDDGSAAPRIARTRQEAAQAVGVNIRTFATWLSDPTFPGKAGSPGRQDGYFPIEEISDWWARKQGAAATVASGPESPRERYLRLRSEQEEIELKRMRGELAEVADVERLMRRTIAVAKAGLLPLPDQLLADLPAELPTSQAVWDELRQRQRDRAEKALRDCFAVIASLLTKENDDDDATE